MFGLIALAIIFGGAAISSGSGKSEKDESLLDDEELDISHLGSFNLYQPYKKKESEIFKFNSSGYDHARQIYWTREDKYEIK